MGIRTYIPGNSLAKFQEKVAELNERFDRYLPTLALAQAASAAKTKDIFGSAIARIKRDDLARANTGVYNRFIPDYPILTIEAFKYPLDNVFVEVPEFNLLIGDYTVSRTNNLVVNHLNLSGDSIKEFTGQTDYAISFSGILLATELYEKPLEFLESFVTIMNSCMSLPVRSEIFDTLNINNIVIESFEINSNWQTKNVYPISFKCLSDNPLAKFIESNGTFSFKNDAVE